MVSPGNEVKIQMKSFAIILGIFFTAIGLALITAHSPVLQWAVPVVEQHFSPDGHLTRMGEDILARLIYILAAVLISLGVVSFLLTSQALRGKLAFIFSTMATTIPQDHLCIPNRSMSYVLFAVATFGGLGIVATFGIIWVVLPEIQGPALTVKNFEYYLIRHPLYKEDSLFETLTVVLMIAASFFLFRAFRSLRSWYKSENDLSPAYSWVAWTYVVISGGCLFMGLEELSWGQRIIGWETPSLWTEVNVQNETNLHNLFNPLFEYGYRLLAGLLVLTAISLRLSYGQFPPRYFSLLLPHPALIVLAALIAALVFPPLPYVEELEEELVSLFAFCYGFGVLKCSPLCPTQPTEIDTEEESEARAHPEN